LMGSFCEKLVNFDIHAVDAWTLEDQQGFFDADAETLQKFMNR
jgi:hypothetical protein